MGTWILWGIIIWIAAGGLTWWLFLRNAPLDDTEDTYGETEYEAELKRRREVAP